jgi:hypothetical protein
MIDYNAMPPTGGQMPQANGMAPSAAGATPSNYSYANPLGTIPVRTPAAGMASIASALINGYYDGQSQHAPMQLQGATAQPNFLSSLFGAGQPPGAQAVAAPDPSTAGGLY